MFRIKLNPTDETFKTFRDFALDKVYEHRISNDIHIINKLFDYFMNQLVTEKAKVNKLRKQIKLIKTSSNIHLIHKPTVDLTNHTISGVINGGRYGRNGMMGDVAANSE